jgi:hypothetical protein
MSPPIAVCAVTGAAKPNDMVPGAVDELVGAGAHVTLIASVRGGSSIALPEDQIADLQQDAPLSVASRALRRLTLAGSPAARRTWHAIRRNEQARAFLNSADVIVALDSAAVRAVWCAGGASRSAHDERDLVLGVPAALDAIRARATEVSPAAS